MTHGEHPDWTTSALERARYLDGEGTPDERAARAADLLRDPAARARVDADARFLAVVRAAAPAAAVRPSDLLEARVRRALAADRAAGFPSTGAGAARRARRRAFAVAATLAAVAFGSLWWASSDRVPTSEAVFDPVKAAARITTLVGVSVNRGGGFATTARQPHRARDERRGRSRVPRQAPSIWCYVATTRAGREGLRRRAADASGDGRRLHASRTSWCSTCHRAHDVPSRRRTRLAGRRVRRLPQADRQNPHRFFSAPGDAPSTGR
jgi:hypothetical protein